MRGMVAALLLASLISTATAQTQSGEQSTILSPKAIEKQKDEKKSAAQEKTAPQQNPPPQDGAGAEQNIVVPPAPVIIKRNPIAIVIPPQGVNPEQKYKEGNSSPMIVLDGPQVVVIPPEQLKPGEAAPEIKPEIKYEQRPVISNVKIGSLYGYRSDPFTGRARFHSGVDIKARWGDPVGASLAGVVQFAGWYHGYGNLIVINHGGGVTTHYAHLSGYAVAVGMRVERGTIIGHAGSTGRATSPHLHYEVRINDTPVNPLQPLALDATSEFFNTLPSDSTQKQDK
ncbi:MAG TPA: peptidoglycan DD-metalloendopeptidase family protein [Blastocatellia bacterium]|nr:peptidoglycan DD-metalloendopeptidase family protein [Blastocatellia bacterium]